ncbi:MAG TPA: ROK family protein [Clostridiales bacterium]|nr:ROK family protein [Clostridiales bacterium]
MYVVGIDLGGTNIAAGVVDENYNIVGRGKIKTRAPRPAEEIADDMIAAVEMAISDAGLTKEDIEWVGVGAPGTINPITGVIGFSNNLQFNNVPFKSLLEERFNAKFYIENDANAAAFGEFLAGAGRGTKNLVAITLGTGVGGGIIVDGKLIVGSNFAGGELGHVVIQKDGELCTCGRKGCWEAYASATGLIRQTKQAMEKDKNSVMWEICGGDINNVNGRTAFDAMRMGDKTGKEVVDNYIEYLACGIVNVINIFQPDVLCIGGGISKEGETILEPIRKYVEYNVFSKNIDKQTVIKTAELGNDAGIIGAAFLENLYK